MNNSTEHNYGDNHEPNLFNNSISYDHIREKSKNLNDDDDGKQAADAKNLMEEIMKNIDNLKTTETDMKFEYMANPIKLVPDDKIQLFERQSGGHSDDRIRSDTQSDKGHYNSKNNSESLNDYMVKPQQNTQSNTQPNTQPNTHHNMQYQNEYSNPVPKASSYGPSYGDGPSIATTNTQMDKYYGFGSEEELNLAKLDMLRKLGELAQYGVKLSQNYNMNSDYKAMKYEHELHKSIRDKHNGVKWLSNMMLNICWGTELANDNFNPFEFKLKGWSEQMNEDIDDYYDVLGELYEKYFKSGKPIPPELKLVLMIGGSAVKFHIANTAFSKIPSLSQALSQNPALAQKLNEQAVSDKVREQYDKQKEAFDKKSDEQHNIARKKAEDLQMLKEKQTEFTKQQNSSQNQQQIIQQQYMQQQFMQQQMMQQQMMQHQLLDKQKQLEDLQKQLNLQRSDSRSMYTSKSNNSVSKNQKTMAPPVIPSSLRNKFSLASNKTQQNNNQQFEYNNSMNMGIGSVIPNDQMHEMMRQQQIMMHKENLRNNEYNKMNANRIIEDNVSIDPNIDNIINNGFNDNQSRISDDNNSRESVISKGSKRSRKKPSIKINT